MKCTTIDKTVRLGPMRVCTCATEQMAIVVCVALNGSLTGMSFLDGELQEMVGEEYDDALDPAACTAQRVAEASEEVSGGEACMDCFVKHLSTAIVQLGEYNDGIDESGYLAIGHLHEAGREGGEAMRGRLRGLRKQVAAAVITCNKVECVPELMALLGRET